MLKNQDCIFLRSISKNFQETGKKIAVTPDKPLKIQREVLFSVNYHNWNERLIQRSNAKRAYPQSSVSSAHLHIRHLISRKQKQNRSFAYRFRKYKLIRGWFNVKDINLSFVSFFFEAFEIVVDRLDGFFIVHKFVSIHKSF